MTKIEITSDEEIEEYKQFLQYKQTILQEQRVWRDLKGFVKDLGYGSFTLTVKDGTPYRVDNPIKTVILGIKL